MTIFFQIQSCKNKYIPPNDAATATEPAAVPAAVAAAANPLTPITGIIVPKVGARALSPAAIAGAANPVDMLKVRNNKSTRKLIHLDIIHFTLQTEKKSKDPYHQ